MENAKIRPPVESKPLNRLQKNCNNWLRPRARRRPSVSNFVCKSVLGKWMKVKIWNKNWTENFLQKSPIIKFSTVNDHQSSSEHHKGCIAYRQIGIGDSKYVVIFDPYNQVTWRSASAVCYMAVQTLLDIGPLQTNISLTVPVTKEVSTDHL